MKRYYGMENPDDLRKTVRIGKNSSNNSWKKILYKQAERGRSMTELAVLDFETTGLVPGQDEVLQVAVVDGEVLESPSFTVRLSEKKIHFFYPNGASYAPHL